MFFLVQKHPRAKNTVLVGLASRERIQNLPSMVGETVTEMCQLEGQTMVSKLMFLRGSLHGILAIAVLMVAAYSPARRAQAVVTPGSGTSISITSNPSEGSPYEVMNNKDSTLSYKLVFSVGSNSEGATPSVQSIVVTFAINNGGTIQESCNASWTETLTTNLTSPMNLSCQASGPSNGTYTVACSATMHLSDGTTVDSNTASDNFLVADMTVAVTGDPYVIIPFQAGDTSEMSAYSGTAQAANGDGNFGFTRTVPSNIQWGIESLLGTAGQKIWAYGVPNPGPATIKCTATDKANNQTQSGSKAVIVQNEYILKRNPGYTVAVGNYTIASNSVLATANGQPIAFTVTGSTSYTYGLTTTLGADLTIVENILSVSA